MNRAIIDIKKKTRFCPTCNQKCNILTLKRREYLESHINPRTKNLCGGRSL